MSTLVPPSPAASAAPPAPGAVGSGPPPSVAAVRAGTVAGLAGTALRLGAVALSVGTGVVLARVLGPAALGRYEAAMALGAVLAIPAGAGVEKLVVRNVASARVDGDFGHARGLVRAVLGLVLAGSILVASLVLASGSIAGDRLPAGLAIVACGIVPLLACTRVTAAVSQGLGRVVHGQVPELLAVPGAFLAFVLLSAAFGGGSLDAQDALLCQAAAAGVGLLAAAWLLRSGAAQALRGAAPRYRIGPWLLAATPLVGIAALQVASARADVLALTLLGTDAEVGRYATANRVAALVTMALLAVNASFAPAFAELHARGDRLGLERAAKRAARVATAFAVPAALVFLLGGQLVLGVFGKEFESARGILAVLALAQLVNVAFGSVGMLLLMTGHSAAALRGLAASAACNVALQVALVPQLGAIGAAVASATGLILWNVLLTVAVRRRLGIDATILWRRG